MSITDAPQVYLVGAGPGNPLLLSKKAERCIQRADVILYDQLVNPFILQLSSPETEWIHVGKTPYTTYMRQDEINALMIEKTKTHRTVVRLKGGDPAIFGRLADEVDILKAHHITYEVVPGITAASAAMSQLHRGLTERGVARNITFTTGHFKDDEENPIDITTLKNGGTLAIYMGVKRLPKLMQEVQDEIEEDLPVAVIFNATCVNQQVISGHVSSITAKIAALPERPGPGITIVGHVVRNILEEVPALSEIDYVCIQGRRDLCMEHAMDIYENGGWAIIDDRVTSTLHPTQVEILTALIEKTPFTHVLNEA
ncbi:uroporphyrinogen-III C-methyltransferase [Staphylococcus agnetis]|uniref:uroporphyrinogen-III C-methyltransferase n=1 Tax=Staphylococcus agnetis TaxID=985762 RepID=UPI000D0295FF|nr:uroporphyrinogen-III C-methyltransferase [Staphylococcus agnetis]MCO4338022.1 uroporphyrinogen-III C-methyltransferase [Staphylococcus agnetis]MCO4340314.1 uroporphyrinogen-III C-methyltransferase [Staphylococcus agnetis]MCO4343152.1 uroporphyrinogen-III C-methyltransferase [Staphylococcus agnetis]MCO4345096.1 uroporphyrinogen-III C-methyltransferase [Staphylococcus agnetis]MCO4347276.1 uroporphyrinogen-III C-methyltransferase [Staphylococcus agnetis]